MTIDRVPGIHHVTAIASDPQRNVRFYTGVLGLRLVKRTVNFDDPATYHLYYGDSVGMPGTILTFFPWPGADAGRVGAGQVVSVSFHIPEESVDYWLDRFDQHGVDVDGPRERFGQTVIVFRDPDGEPLELVATAAGGEPWAGGPVPVEHGIRGFFGASLLSTDPASTISVLDTLGFERADDADGRTRFFATDEPGRVVDVVRRANAPVGRQGPGTVHHIAFRTADDDTQAAWRERLLDADLSVTPQKDRQYFRSIYFREPGGILFELATDGPGFTRDEPEATLGSTLQLPPWLAGDRDAIAAQLPPIEIPRQEDASS